MAAERRVDLGFFWCGLSWRGIHIEAVDGKTKENYPYVMLVRNQSPDCIGQIDLRGCIYFTFEQLELHWNYCPATWSDDDLDQNMYCSLIDLSDARDVRGMLDGTYYRLPSYEYETLCKFVEEHADPVAYTTFLAMLYPDESKVEDEDGLEGSENDDPNANTSPEQDDEKFDPAFIPFSLDDQRLITEWAERMHLR